MEKYIGKGRGVSTNVPELELIQQVRIRPLLYDKNVKDYRKPGVSDVAWQAVADSLNTSVSNCKKRWKSLRDTFIKYYRIEMLQKSDSNRKRKQWIFFKDLSFLMPHVELYRLDDTSKLDEHANDSVSNYLKEDYIDDKQYYFNAGDEDNSEVTYQIKISDEYDENETEEHYEEERLEDGTLIDIEEANQIMVNKVIEKLDDEHTTYVVLEENNEQNIDNSTTQSSIQMATPTSQSEQTTATHSHQQQLQPSTTCTNLSPPSKSIIDPDERYLLSCLPAFKRFTPQQKAYVRMGIEKLFYEVEFEKIDEPQNKRRRDS
ncbi:hypothetical protein PVAND_004817 [Polypedilum vanderplanki]|uniref:Transcription factor Adf-1 n=1 Tax=Polypedilum vanderplanki TaxID=319348 RepID=A0A9J6BYW4_POLVA|nr:hypothetical protein PVAND_004817 [Polypedilum vanderplanki]